MRLDIPKKIHRQEWLLRLGVRGDADEKLEESFRQMEQQLLETAVPQGVYRILAIDQLNLEGNAIRKHLNGCHAMAVMGVTLGAGTDRLIRISQIRNMADAVLLDCGASVLIEQICDAFESEIRKDTDGYMTGRYSPGYGDLPVETQDHLIRAVDGARAIGLTVNRNHIMIPRKSVTAILGISDHPVTGYLATCEECTLKETCVLRKEGKNCAGI